MIEDQDVRRIAYNSLNNPGGTAVVRGDILVANSTPALAPKAVGAANTALTSDGTDPAWASITTAMLAANAVTQIVAATMSTNFSTTSGTLVDVTSASVTMTTTGGNVLILWTGPASMSAAQGLFDYRLDSTDSGSIHHVVAATVETNMCGFNYYTGVSAASHTWKLRARTSDGASTLTMNFSSVAIGLLLGIEFKR